MRLAGENDAAALEVVFDGHVEAAYALSRMCGPRASADGIGVAPQGSVAGRVRLALQKLRESVAGCEATA